MSCLGWSKTYNVKHMSMLFLLPHTQLTKNEIMRLDEKYLTMLHMCTLDNGYSRQSKRHSSLRLWVRTHDTYVRFSQCSAEGRGIFAGYFPPRKLTEPVGKYPTKPSVLTVLRDLTRVIYGGSQRRTCYAFDLTPPFVIQLALSYK